MENEREKERRLCTIIAKRRLGDDQAVIAVSGRPLARLIAKMSPETRGRQAVIVRNHSSMVASRVLLGILETTELPPPYRWEHKVSSPSVATPDHLEAICTEIASKLREMVDSVKPVTIKTTLTTSVVKREGSAV
jgi:hypothetical protein